MSSKIARMVGGLKADTDSRILRGYASNWSIDHANERFAPGCWKKTINEKFSSFKAKGEPVRVAFLYSHDREKVLGTVETLREDSHGLYFEGRVSQTQFGDDILTLVRDGALDGFSVGFRPIQHRWEDGVRVFTEAALGEVSLVSAPCNEEARVRCDTTELAIKSLYDSYDRAMRKLIKSMTARMEKELEEIERRSTVRGAVNEITRSWGRKEWQRAEDYIRSQVWGA